MAISTLDPTCRPNVRLYEYIAIMREYEDEDGKIVPAKILIPPTPVLATDPSHAVILAGREVPQEYIDRFDDLDIRVRPF